MNHLAIPTVILALLLGSCSPTVDNRGYEVDNRDFNKIIPGKSTKQTVEEAYGSPSTVSAFKPETWFYISKQTETKAFLTPQTLELTTYEVSFNDANIVSKVVERKGEHAREINPVKRETPSAGHQTGLLREVFSNFGKIATKGGSRTGSP
ncbi:outer membrane protein assembly factor BamE [Candidatus Odyssella thessalonicensis]|uniref:outer membrane protein assembly factor BamE n=1 Tax=Candidatus Odyssella thessalonicensis TaxID=84647 RepID=UPI000225C076|nr:outer membrane protein assembly factor BamE [Candidatus Odyssella thessalonicensis]